MARELLFLVCAYLSGSVLYARVFGRLFGKDVTLGSSDGNPGTFNAFQNGGFWCGLLTLLGDLAKGFVPVGSATLTIPTWSWPRRCWGIFCRCFSASGAARESRSPSAACWACCPSGGPWAR